MTSRLPQPEALEFAALLESTGSMAVATGNLLLAMARNFNDGNVRPFTPGAATAMAKIVRSLPSPRDAQVAKLLALLAAHGAEEAGPATTLDPPVPDWKIH